MAAVQVRQSESKMSPHVEERADATLACAALLDASAFSSLYLRYADRVFRHCYRRLGSREAAEDATSLVFTKALGALDRFDPNRGSFATWLFTIANRVLTDHYRSQRRFVDAAEFPEPIDPDDTPEEAALARENAVDLHRALGQLAPREREVIELRLAGLSSAEISEVLGCRKNSVAQAQYRAIGRLRMLLAPGVTQQGTHDV